MTSRSTTLVDALARTVHRRPGARAARWVVSGTWSAITWEDLGTGVRHAALALDAAGVGRGDQVLVDVADPLLRWQAELAALAAGGAVVLPGIAGEGAGGHPMPSGADVGVRVTDAARGATTVTVGRGSGGETPWRALLEEGRALDGVEPDRYERLRSRLTGDDVALVAAGGDGSTHAYTHSAVDWALRSLQRAVRVGPDDRIAVTLDVRTAMGWLLVAALASHAGAEVTAGGDVDLAVMLTESQPTVVVAGPAAWSAVAVGLDLEPRWLAPLERSQAVSVRARRALGNGVRRRRLRPAGLASCRAAIVLGGPADGTGPADVAHSLRARGVAAHGALAVDGVLGPVTMAPGGTRSAGAPMPGVTVGVDDDGTLAVRAGSAGRAVPAEASPDWVATGLAASLDDHDNVVLGPSA